MRSPISWTRGGRCGTARVASSRARYVCVGLGCAALVAGAQTAGSAEADDRFTPPPPIWRRVDDAPTVRFDLPDYVVPRRLTCGDELEGLAGRQGTSSLFVWRVPPNTERLEISLEGGSGDADLYVRHRAAPTPTVFDARPYVRGNDEQIMLDRPPSGDWYIVVHGYTAYSGATLSVMCRVFDAPHDELEPGVARDIELAMYYEFTGGREVEDHALQPELRQRALRTEGRLAFNAGDYERAIEVWREWAALAPENPEPVALIGDTYLRQQQLDEAVEKYRRSLAIQPGQIRLMVRLARLLDVEMERPDKSRELLNHYERLFPEHPEIVLAKAEWLIRRRRYQEAGRLIDRVLVRDAENLRALVLRHTLLETTVDRFANLQEILAVGYRPGADPLLARVILDHHLLTRPESWVLLAYIDDVAFRAPEAYVRETFQSLLPRTEVAVEDFGIGRLSRSWASSRDQMWDDDGALVLGADPTQTEAYLRLEQSDAMPSGFIEADIEGTRGYFWMYARRGEGNMVRFGFDEPGNLYQQVWINGQLHLNESRLWAQDTDVARLRLEVRGDGIFSYIDGRPAFHSPLSIPRDMGLGWWGLAPWAPEPGYAAVNIHRAAGGPLAARLLWWDYTERPPDEPRSGAMLERLRRLMNGTVAAMPDWYAEADDGRWQRNAYADDQELRLLARFHRARLMPVVRLRAETTFDWDEASRVAARDRLDGFTIPVYKMPPPEWLRAAEAEAVERELAINLLLWEPAGTRARLREIAPFVGLLPGPRRVQPLNVALADDIDLDDDADWNALGNTIIRLRE